jgi:hypothetical protein
VVEAGRERRLGPGQRALEVLGDRRGRRRARRLDVRGRDAGVPQRLLEGRDTSSWGR